jgi:hypothetical protein
VLGNEPGSKQAFDANNALRSIALGRDKGMGSSELKTCLKQRKEQINEMCALQRKARGVRFLMGLALLLTVVSLLLTGRG